MFVSGCLSVERRVKSLSVSHKSLFRCLIESFKQL